MAEILVVCQYYYPEEFRINDICDELSKRGYNVTVLTGLPNYPKGKVLKEYKFFKKRSERINGVKVLRVTEFGRRNNSISLFLNYLSFMIFSSIKVLFMRKKFDIVLAYQLSPITMVYPATLYKKFNKVPLIVYCCDIWPESMKNKIKDEKNYLYSKVSNFSRRMYSSADHIAVSSKSFIDYLYDKHKISKSIMSYIPQHAEDKYLEIKAKVNKDRQHFVFMGNIGIAQDTEIIVKAAHLISNVYDFQIHFVGDGSFLGELKEITHELNMDKNVIFHGRKPLSEMDKYYELADVCLITLNNDSYIGNTVPSKLQGYMAAGKPVIGAISGSAKDLIEESNCGRCVESGDIEGLKTVFIDFFEGLADFKKLGINGRNFFLENFTKEKYINEIAKKLDRLMEE